MKEITPSPWRSPLLALFLALLAYVGVSGVWIWVDPRSKVGQTHVLAHTVAGIVALFPWSLYQFRHLRATWGKPLSHHLVLGWAAGVLILAAMASGVVVTAEAAFGKAVPEGWRVVHLSTGLASFGLAALHVAVVAWRGLAASGAPGSARTCSRTGFACAAGLVLAAGGTAAVPVRRTDAEFPAGYRRPFGDSPFAPSLATTSSGGAVSPDALAGSASCGTSGCHEEIVREWEPSAHRYASRSRFFQGIQKAMAANNGPESTRYCAGCHDPIALFSGAKNLYDEDLSSPGADEGVSCAACHSIARTDVRGNADYTLQPPAPYLFEGGYGEGVPFATRFLMRAVPDLHRESYGRALLKTPELCGACHKQFIDEKVNGVGWVQLQNQYDNWRKSHWFQAAEGTGGKVADPERTISCRECHMPLAPSSDPSAGDASDFNRDPSDGKHRSHRFLGANQWLPSLHALPGAEKHVRLTGKWLRGEIPVPEIADRWVEGPAVSVEIVAPGRVAAGEEVALRVLVASRKVGHDFPTGPLDIIQCWVELTATDGEGRETFVSGRVDERGFLQEGTFLFKAEGVDRAGNLIDRHNLWEMVGARFRRALFPGVTDAAEYRFPAPERGPLAIRARLRYRKVDQTLVEFLFPGEGMTAPITEMAETGASIEVGGP